MDKLKKIRIKQSDGTYGPEIPVSVAAEEIVLNNEKNLETSIAFVSPDIGNNKSDNETILNKWLIDNNDTKIAPYTTTEQIITKDNKNFNTEWEKIPITYATKAEVNTLENSVKENYATKVELNALESKIENDYTTLGTQIDTIEKKTESNAEEIQNANSRIDKLGGGVPIRHHVNTAEFTINSTEQEIVSIPFIPTEQNFFFNAFIVVDMQANDIVTFTIRTEDSMDKRLSYNCTKGLNMISFLCINEARFTPVEVNAIKILMKSTEAEGHINKSGISIISYNTPAPPVTA